MLTFKKLLAAGLIATAAAVALPAQALAGAGEDASYGYGTDYYRSMVSQYRDYIARLSADNRTKLMAMQDKLMQMEMDQKKMDMEMTKAKRDIEMFILIYGGGK